VTSIGARAFENCKALKNVTVLWATPQSVGVSAGVFENVNLAGLTLNVPAGAKTLYQMHEIWGQFGSIADEI
jgi:hypothetical protein